MKKNFSSESVQTLVRWCIILFFVYIFIHSYFNTSKPITLTEVPPVLQHNAETAKRDDCNKQDKYPLMSMSLMPEIIPVIKTGDTKMGEGAEAVCGQKATLHYVYTVQKEVPVSKDKKTILLDRGKALQNAERDMLNRKGTVVAKGTKEIVIGAGKEMHGIELGLLGMKKGGERHVILPAEFAVGIDPEANIPATVKDKTIIADLTLSGLSPPIAVSPFPLQVINTGAIGGAQAFCGNRVQVNMAIWKTDATKIFSTEGNPITFVPGQSSLPYGIEQGILGMTEGSERVIMLPPAYNKPLIEQSGKTALLPALPDKEILVVQIRLLHIDDLPAKETPAEPKPAPAAEPADGDSDDETQDKEK